MVANASLKRPRLLCFFVVLSACGKSSGLISRLSTRQKSGLVRRAHSQHRTASSFFPFAWQRPTLQTAGGTSCTPNDKSRSNPAWVDDARQRFEPTDMPTAAPTLLGLVLLTFILCGLVVSPEDAADLDADVATEALRGSSQVVTKVVDQVLPNSVSDTVALTLSEGVAGAASSAVLFGASSAVRAGRDFAMRLMDGTQSEDGATMGSGAFDEAVATADFFYARTAAAGALEGMNVPAAQILAVVLAQVPYQLSKASASRKEMAAVAAAAAPPPSKPLPPPSPALQLARAAWGTARVPAEAAAAAGAAAAGALSTAGDSSAAVAAAGAGSATEAVTFLGIDGVEAVSDLIKWLEYDVLVSDYDDTLFGALVAAGGDDPQILSGLESGLFGAVAALSAQAYLDGSLFAGYGKAKSKAALAVRSPVAWVVTYARAMASGALLFGGYETLRKPISQFALELLSGGGLACWGSGDYDLCVDIYLLDSLPYALLQSFTGNS